MGIFNDLMTRRQRAGAPRLDPVKENKKARATSLEEAEEKITALAKARNQEVEDLEKAIREAEAEIEREQEATATAIKDGNFSEHRAHSMARREAEEAATAYRLRLDAVKSTTVIPKEDAVALIRSLDGMFYEEIRDAFKAAADLISRLEDLDEELAQKVNRYAFIARMLERDVLRGDDLYFIDENGCRRYVSLMISGYADKGHALRALIYAMKRVPDEYSIVTGKPQDDRSAFNRIY